MSAESPSGSEPNPPVNPSSAADGGADADAPEFPRRKNRYRQAEGEVVPGKHDEQIVVLSSLLASLMEKNGAAEPLAKEAKIFRFKDKKPFVAAKALPLVREKIASVLAPAPLVSEPPAAIGNAPAPTESPAPAAKPESAAATPDRPQPEGAILWRTPFNAEEARSLPGFLFWALLVLAVVIAFLAGRWTSGNPFRALAAEQSGGPTASTTVNWSKEDIAQLDGVLEADQAGDLNKADQLAKSLKSHEGSLPGLEAYLNVIVARKQRFADAESSLSRMISPSVQGEQLALLSDAMGFNYARQRRFPLASDTFRLSILAEPFAAENFRLLAESLRREGHMQQAIASFNEALVRYPVGAVEYMDLREYIAYKIRLSQIEGSLPVDARSEATERTATADSAGYWFMTEAAVALQQGNGDGGAAALREAKAALPGSLFYQLLGDYFFRAFAGTSQVAGFFPPAGSDPLQKALLPHEVYFIDP